MGNLGVTELLVVAVVIFLFASIVLIPYWRIFKRAGFPPVLSLLMIIPIANIVTLYFLAFARWPVLETRGSSGAS